MKNMDFLLYISGLAPSGPKISSSSPPRPMQNKPPLHPHSTLPQALPPGTLNLARVTRANQYDVEPIPQPTTPQVCILVHCMLRK